MKKKSIFKLFAIILGLMMFLNVAKVQASEGTSVFTGSLLTTRSTLETDSSLNTLRNISINEILEISKYRESGNAYTWNPNTTGEAKTIWKIATLDSSNVRDYSDLYYCLNATRGFGVTNGEMVEGHDDNYTNAFDMNSNKQNIITYSGGNIEANYNKILWILDNSYIPTGKEKYQETVKYKDLMENANIQINDDERLNLTEDDIEVVQQMAIWYFTNSDNSNYNNSKLPSLYLNGTQLSSKYLYTTIYGEQITGKEIQNKAEKLYNYFITNASATYTRQYPTLEIKIDINTVVTESENRCIVGPYSLVGNNLDKVKEIKVISQTHKYTLLDNSKNTVKDNDFIKVLGENFYIQIPKSEINQTTEVKLSLQYTYDYKTLTFMTNVSDPTNTQPVVKVTSDTIEEDLELKAQIELVNKTVEKIWEDNNDQDGVRPNQVKVQLYKNGEKSGESITLNKLNNWTYTWTKLLKGNTYEIKELNSSNNAVEEGRAYNNDYTAKYVVSGDKTTITNTHVPEVISKTVTKTWEDNNNQDNIRPEYVKVILFKSVNGIKEKVEEIELNQANEWKYTWNNLDKYKEGKEIAYTVEEIVPNNYTVSYSADTFNITNKYTPGITSRTVVKEWDDQDNVDGIRPNQVTMQLYANGEEYGQEIVLNKENGFTYTWTALPEKENGTIIEYTISETKIGEEEVENNNAAKYDVEYQTQGNITTVTNIHIPEKTSKTVTKVWNDNDNKNNVRPESIKVQLYANSEKYGSPITLTSGSDKVWENQELTYTWSELPLKEDGEEITYTVKELDSEGNPVENGKMYDGKYTATYSEDTFTITNTYKEFDLALRKFITQINDEKYLREPLVDTATIETTGTATYKHVKTPIAVQKGDIVTYTIRVYNEGELDGYVNEITDHLPNNLIPIIDGVEGIDSEKYKEEIDFNSNWLWEFSGNGETVKTQITKADKASNLPGISDEEQEEARLLKAYVEGANQLDYVDVQIKCLVTDKVESNEYLTNIAEITESEDINGVKGDGNDSKLGNVDYSNLSDYKNQEAINSTKDSYVPGQEDDDDFEKLIVKEFDLSLRKFITKVNETTYSRVPVVDTTKLGTVVDGKTITTATYSHSKEPVIVETNDLVTYTIRIYNEGTLAGYANEITDNIPEGLEFVPDNSVNVSYRWRMLDKDGNETEDLSKAVMIVTDYLSDIDKNNVIDAVSEVDGVKTLSYKDVEVQFKVIAKPQKLQDNLIINEAQISSDSDRDIDSIPNRDEKYNYTSGNNEDDIDYEPIKLQYFDLALRKFITKVNETEYNNRYPEIVYNEDSSITYNHTKDPVLVATGDTVIYTIRIYNEGEKAGYASEITDNLPDGLEFLPENETNKQYEWKMLDKEGNVTDDITKAIKFSTDYLKDDLISALVVENGQKILSYKDVQVAFKVVEPNTSDRILVNIAEISEDSDNDIDSTPGNDVLTEDDIDREYVKVQYFDLSIKKWVTRTQVTYNGKTTTTKTGFTEDSDEIAKVDLVANKMNKTTVKFAYNIKVTNEGELPGYAYEVKDYIPKGLKFVEADNKDWKELEDGSVVTGKLKDTLLNPGESATVEIILTWKNSTTNTGLKTNYAEISKDSADDIDSVPDNNVLTEDDIDDAQVILSIKTAGAPTYIGLVFLSVAILAGGIFLIKKYVIQE